MKRYFLTSVTIALAIFSLSSNANSEGEAMYSALGCVSCHGQNGHSTDENAPSLAGKDADWIVQQLEYFQSGERQNSYMNSKF
jgi:cytochrome c553